MSKKIMTKIRAIIITAIIVAALAGGTILYHYIVVPPPPPVPVEEFRVALLFPYSGPMAPLGFEQGEAARMAIDMYNELYGGILGRVKVTYIIADSRSDPKVAESEAERLCTIEKVPVIIGSYASPLLLPASMIAEKYKVIYWEVGAIVDLATLRGFKYLFRPQTIGVDFGYPSVVFIAEKIAPALGKKPEEVRVAIINEDGPYGMSVAEGQVMTCEKFGIPVVFREAYSAKALDLSYLVLKVKAAEPDVLLATSYFGDTVLFLKQAKELGLKVSAIIGHGAGYGLPATYEAIGEDLTYIFNVDPASAMGINPEGLKPEIRKILLEYLSRWRKTYGRDPLTHSNMGFGNTWILLTDVLPRALEKYGSLDPESIRKAALETDIPEGGTTLGYGVKFASPEAPEDTAYGKILRVDKPQLHIGQNVRAIPIMHQWFPGGKLYVVWPDVYALKTPEVPLPPVSPYAP